MGSPPSGDKLDAELGVPVPPDSDKSDPLQDLMNAVFEKANPLEELASVAVTDRKGVAEDISDVVKDINDGIYSLNFGDGDGSLQLSVTQSQIVDGTETVTRADDVALQLQLEDERVRKKKSDHLRRKELERYQKAACVQPQADVGAQVVRDEGGAKAGATAHPVAGGTDILAKLNLLETRLSQVFSRYGVKVKKAIAKRKVRDANSDVTPRRSPQAKAACQTGDREADVDNVVV